MCVFRKAYLCPSGTVFFSARWGVSPGRSSHGSRRNPPRRRCAVQPTPAPLRQVSQTSRLGELIKLTCAFRPLQRNRTRRLKASGRRREGGSCTGWMLAVSATTPGCEEGHEQVPSVSQLTYHWRGSYVPCPVHRETLSMRHQGLL